MKTDLITCPACGDRMTGEVRPLDFGYHGQHITIGQPGWYCPACGEGVHDGHDMAATDKAFQEFKAQVDGVLAPAEVRRIRGQLGLSQRKASRFVHERPVAKLIGFLAQRGLHPEE